MKSIILFVICFLSSSVGSVVGAGGGVIIKPVLDITGLLPVAAASFGSGCTVLAMAVSSLIRGRRDGVRLQLKTSTPLALGAVTGGLLGKGLFDAAGTYFEEQSSLGALQSGCLTVVMAAVFFYLKYKDRIRGKQVEQPLAAVAIGVALGVISSFLGIGGGPFNVAVLFFFFAMDAKEAAKNSLYVILFSQTASLLLTLLRGSVPVEIISSKGHAVARFLIYRRPSRLPSGACGCGASGGRSSRILRILCNRKPCLCPR